MKKTTKSRPPPERIAIIVLSTCIGVHRRANVLAPLRVLPQPLAAIRACPGELTQAARKRFASAGKPGTRLEPRVLVLAGSRVSGEAKMQITSQHNIELGFTHESVPAGTHTCLVYSGEDERAGIIARFIRGGLAAGERVACFSDASPASELNERFLRHGFELPKPETGGQFTVASASDTNCPHGRFVPEEMFGTRKAFHSQVHADGYPASRVSGEMLWALRGVPGCERLMESESKVNEVFEKYPVTAICRYDANRFDARTLMECLKVHPFVIVNGQILRNTHYVKPGKYRQTVRNGGQELRIQA